MFKAFLKMIIEFLEDQIFAHFKAFYVDYCIIKPRKKELLSRKFSLKKTTPQILTETLDKVEHDYKNEIERRNQIVDKGRAGLFVIGLTVTLMMTILKYNHQVSLSVYEIGLLLVAVVSFVLSAITFVMAVKIRERHGVYLDRIINANGSSLTIVKESSENKIKELYHIGKLNQLETTIISNYVDASYIGLRNGIISLAVFFMISLFR